MTKYHCQLLICKWKWEKMQDDWCFCDYIYNKTIIAILLTRKNGTWGGVLLSDQLPSSAISHGSCYTTEQSYMKSLALPLIHYYWLFMYVWTNVKHQMHPCGSRELQHIECFRIRNIVFFNCLITLTASYNTSLFKHCMLLSHVVVSANMFKFSLAPVLLTAWLQNGVLILSYKDMALIRNSTASHQTRW